MKKSCVFLAVLVCAAVLLQGCAMVSQSFQPVTGFIFSDVHGPGDVSGADMGSKSGTARAESFLGWIAMGNASVHAAATDGGITKIAHTDYHAWSILGVYARMETYVYGN